jgi:hypothetical protein
VYHVLVDGGQFVCKQEVQHLDDFFFALHFMLLFGVGW